MAEGEVDSSPQVFVVDSQATSIHPAPHNKPTWTKVAQKSILLLVMLCLFGLVVEGYFINKLFQATENGVKQVQGNEASHEALMSKTLIDPQKTQPMAHLMGSGSPVGDKNVVLWLSKDGGAVIKNMSYRNGSLIIQEEGTYYIYNKVQLNTAECSEILHKVKRSTVDYGLPLDLMTSTISHCPHSTRQKKARTHGGENLKNSFLAGIFNLKPQDKIYVTVEPITTLSPGHTQNYLGAFLIA